MFSSSRNVDGSSFDNMDGRQEYTIIRKTANGMRDGNITYKDFVKPFEDQINAVQLENAKYREQLVDIQEEVDTLKAAIKKMVQVDKAAAEERVRIEDMEGEIQEKVEELMEGPRRLVLEAVERLNIIKEEEEKMDLEEIQRAERESALREFLGLADPKKNNSISIISDSEDSEASDSTSTHSEDIERFAHQSQPIVYQSDILEEAEEREKIVLAQEPRPELVIGEALRKPASEGQLRKPASIQESSKTSEGTGLLTEKDYEAQLMNLAEEMADMVLDDEEGHFKLPSSKVAQNEVRPQSPLPEAPAPFPLSALDAPSTSSLGFKTYLPWASGDSIPMFYSPSAPIYQNFPITEQPATTTFKPDRSFSQWQSDDSKD